MVTADGVLRCRMVASSRSVQQRRAVYGTPVDCHRELDNAPPAEQCLTHEGAACIAGCIAGCAAGVDHGNVCGDVPGEWARAGRAAGWRVVAAVYPRYAAVRRCASVRAD